MRAARRSTRAWDTAMHSLAAYTLQAISRAAKLVLRKSASTRGAGHGQIWQACRERARACVKERIVVAIKQLPVMALFHQMASRSGGGDEYEVMRIGIQNLAPARQVETEQKIVVNYLWRIHSVVAAVDENFVRWRGMPN